MCDPEAAEETLFHETLVDTVTVSKSVAKVLKKNGWKCVVHEADAETPPAETETPAPEAGPPVPEPAARNYADRTTTAAAARAAKNEENS